MVSQGCPTTISKITADVINQTPNTYEKFFFEFDILTSSPLSSEPDIYSSTLYTMTIIQLDDLGNEIEPLPWDFSAGIYSYNYQSIMYVPGPILGQFEFRHIYQSDLFDIKTLFPNHTSSKNYVVRFEKIDSNVMGTIKTECFTQSISSIGLYQGVDADGDGIYDIEDNCINTPNTNQSDADGDGVGDVCDNCPNYSNVDQEDYDNDGLGDFCDEDDDNDGVLDVEDNCPLVANPDQADADNDGVGNLCDDDDGDGILDINDNCPETANADQADADADGVGDVCDNCEDTINTDQADNDGDNIGNVCDNCPNNSNSSQTDSDGDGIGDVCDNDVDGDGVNNSNDNCPNEYNPDQADSDNDGLGDECDDTDNNALANLTWGNIIITVSGTTYNVGNGQTPVFKKNQYADFQITVVNNDDGDAGAFPTYLGVSTSSSAYPNGAASVYGFDTPYFNNGVDANSNSTVNISHYISDYIVGLQLFENTTYYMFFDIDYDNSIVESNENINDNIYVFPFRWDDPNTAGRVAYLNIGDGIITIPLDQDLIPIPNNNKIIRDNLKVYSLLNPSIPLINLSVSNDQTIDASFLPNGTYAVHVNDSYVKKFKKQGMIILNQE